MSSPSSIITELLAITGCPRYIWWEMPPLERQILIQLSEYLEKEL